ncbi:hypothetical protein D9757_003200 [Collybiopsis confluens]|uniref:Uncharacterized protein n=1 Tax=Collybiopsis confluens TaxID=2823264 RepID=A0A8H5HYZ1_9AGAR|nr:hypothetical protein D9757_003200 [Collybiopsis confluens]
MAHLSSCSARIFRVDIWISGRSSSNMDVLAPPSFSPSLAWPCQIQDQDADRTLTPSELEIDRYGADADAESLFGYRTRKHPTTVEAVECEKSELGLKSY